LLLQISGFPVGLHPPTQVFFLSPLHLLINVLLSDGVLLLRFPARPLDPLFKLLHFILRPEGFPRLWGCLDVVLGREMVIQNL
jgi:hypothetical protein